MKVLPTVTLTSNQKRVLAKIFASPTPKVAGEEIAGDENLAAARDQLGKLGAIEFISGEASVTEKGEQLAKDENIVDDAGQLTPDGEQLAHTTAGGKEEKDEPGKPEMTPPPGVVGAPAPNEMPGAMGGLAMSHVPTYSPLKFLKELLEGDWWWTSEHPEPHEGENLRAYQQGLRAVEQGLDSSENPYPKKTPEYTSWMQGYLYGMNIGRQPRAFPTESTELAKQGFSVFHKSLEEAQQKKVKVVKPKSKPSTPEQRMKGRERHWRKTGVSDRTIKWMKDEGML